MLSSIQRCWKSWMRTCSKVCSVSNITQTYPICSYRPPLRCNILTECGQFLIVFPDVNARASRSDAVVSATLRFGKNNGWGWFRKKDLATGILAHSGVKYSSFEESLRGFSVQNKSEQVKHIFTKNWVTIASKA